MAVSCLQESSPRPLHLAGAIQANPLLLMTPMNGLFSSEPSSVTNPLDAASANSLRFRSSLDGTGHRLRTERRRCASNGRSALYTKDLMPRSSAGFFTGAGLGEWSCVGSVQVGSPQAGSAQVGSSHAGSLQVESAHFDSTGFSAWDGSLHAGSLQVESPHFDSTVFSTSLGAAAATGPKISATSIFPNSTVCTVAFSLMLLTSRDASATRAPSAISALFIRIVLPPSICSASSSGIRRAAEHSSPSSVHPARSPAESHVIQSVPKVLLSTTVTTCRSAVLSHAG
mmetsp:Transcript_35209/g.69387  ORF Transcript_35209/g.69387 Transcript_35209/m.69387 type:complete len:285 (-) Transcript_35209:711-1565(-)